MKFVLLLVRLLSLQLLFPNIVVVAQPATLPCPATGTFDTFLHIRFRFRLYDLPTAVIEGIPDLIVEAYNVLTGLDCDPCARRIVAVNAASPPELVDILARRRRHHHARERHLQMAQADAESFTA